MKCANYGGLHFGIYLLYLYLTYAHVYKNVGYLFLKVWVYRSNFALYTKQTKS